jgi:hypothetical protein
MARYKNGAVFRIDRPGFIRRVQVFREAFRKDSSVGMIAVPNPGYDARHWWRYSEGDQAVFGEAIAYLCAKLFCYRSGTNGQLRAGT